MRRSSASPHLSQSTSQPRSGTGEANSRPIGRRYGPGHRPRKIAAACGHGRAPKPCSPDGLGGPVRRVGAEQPHVIPEQADHADAGVGTEHLDVEPQTVGVSATQFLHRKGGSAATAARRSSTAPRPAAAATTAWPRRTRCIRRPARDSPRTTTGYHVLHTC